MGGKKKLGETLNDRLKFSDLEEFTRTMKYEMQLDESIGINSLMHKIIALLNQNKGNNFIVNN